MMIWRIFRLMLDDSRCLGAGALLYLIGEIGINKRYDHNQGNDMQRY